MSEFNLEEEFRLIACKYVHQIGTKQVEMAIESEVHAMLMRAFSLGYIGRVPKLKTSFDPVTRKLTVTELCDHGRPHYLPCVDCELEELT